MLWCVHSLCPSPFLQSGSKQCSQQDDSLQSGSCVFSYSHACSKRRPLTSQGLATAKTLHRNAYLKTRCSFWVVASSCPYIVLLLWLLRDLNHIIWLIFVWVCISVRYFVCEHCFVMINGKSPTFIWFLVMKFDFDYFSTQSKISRLT